MGKKLSCGCDEDEFNQPDCVKCGGCGRFIVFPFGTGHDWVGLCRCKDVVYKWNGHSKTLTACAIDRRPGGGVSYDWTEIRLPTPQEFDKAVKDGTWKEDEKKSLPKVFVKALVAPGVHVCQIVNENKEPLELWLETAEGSRQTRTMVPGSSIYL